MVLPNHLLEAGRVGTGGEDGLHLGDADLEDAGGDEPADALVAGRGGQAALVGEEGVEAGDGLEGVAEVEGHGLLRLGIVPAVKGLGELGEEGVLDEVGNVDVEGGGAGGRGRGERGLFGWCRVDAETHHGLFVALGVHVDKVQLGVRADAVDDVVGGGVNVPAHEVDGLVVVRHGWVGRVVAVQGLVERKGRAVAPIAQGARGVGAVVESRAVLAGQAVDLRAQGDGRLLCAGLAEFIVCVREKVVLVIL
jgi:hypothetical protein